MRFSRAVVGALLSGALLVTGGCTSAGRTNGNGYIEGDSQVIQFGVDERKDPIELSAETIAGDELDLADYRGQIVVVNAWGSWCGPCNREMPLLAEAAEELGDRAAFLGINIRDSSRDDALAFERSHGVEYPSLDGSSDPSVLLAFRGSFRPAAVPSTAVLDEEGRVAAIVSGEVPSVRTLVGMVEDVEKGSG